MATRRSQATTVAQSEASASTSLQVELDSDRLSAAFANWEADGQETLKQILSNQTEADLVTASTIPVTNTITSILKSEISVDHALEFLVSLTASWENERKEVLWEALVDAVAALSEDMEDCRDLKQGQDSTMEVDGQQSLPAAEKGVQVVKSLLASAAMPVAIPTLVLPNYILSQLGLMPYPHNEETIKRAHTRRNTALHYKQSKFNLLRESSEGFSGLIVLLTSGEALSDDSQTETDDEVRGRAKRVWAKVMGLIGYFNLSPPRVLDVILEIASCHVAAHWRFWLELIRCSPWGGVEKTGKGKEKAQLNWAEQECADVRGVLDWDGDRVLAQVLGAKFGFCQRPDGGDTPIGLVYIAALLVKHGFVGLVDLLPFMSPSEDEMDGIRQAFIDSTTSRSGPNNALANTILADDDPPSSSSAKDAEPTGPPAKPPPEQRIQLLQALLSLGDVASAQYFLAKYPWTAQSHPAIADLILRLIGNALEDVFREEVPGLETVDEDSGQTASIATKEVIPTLYAPSPPETPTRIFKFFYPGWRVDAEKWTSPADVYEKGLRWFSLIRGMGGRAGGIMAKICRVGTKHFASLKAAKEEEMGFSSGTLQRDEMRQTEPTTAEMEPEMEPWLNILRVLLLPALSNSSASAPFDIDLWALIRHFPYTVRYQLYGEWRDFTCDAKKANFNCPIAVKASAECTREIKKALSRVTASQSSALPTAQERGPARALAKLSHTNPCALWTTAVTQVKAYPNIGASIVDAGRYMNQLAMDVATFTLVDILASERSSRTNPQGTEVAQWLENIAAFVGDFNRRYAAMDLEPILQYIINKLMRGESDDLTILSRVIQRMYGVDTVENNGVSDAQLEAYATGKQMIHEAFWTTQILLVKPTDDPANKAKAAPFDKAKSTKKSLPRLIDALRDTKLAIPIWIALAQTRQGVVDKLCERQPDTPLKALGLMHDKVHDIFIQYGDLLGDQLENDELVSLVPDFSTLTEDFGLDFPLAFQIIRPRLRAQIWKDDRDKLAMLKERLLAQKEAAKANGSASLTPPLSPVPLTPPLSPATDQTMKELIPNAEQPNGVSVPAPKTRSHQHPALQSTMKQASHVLSERALASLGSSFFVVFWHLSMSDIAFSADSYKSAIARINAYDKEVGSWRGGNLAQQKEERKRLKDRAEQLVKERDSQSAYVERMRKRLRTEAPTWFHQDPARPDLSQQLHQNCFYPRALVTPSDAVYVAKMIRTMHDLGTPGFSTVFAYLAFFDDSLPACIFSCTESEARNLARCLKAILVDVDAWHKDQKKFEREGMGKVEGADPASEPGLPGMMYRPKTGSQPKPMQWNGFRTLVQKFHAALYRAIKSCWEQKDFMHVKNGITVALQVLPIFPLIEDHGKDLFSVMEVLERREDLTPDLKQGCKAYKVQLQKRMTTRPYVKSEDFAPGMRSTTANAGTPSKAPPRGPANSTADAAAEPPAASTTKASTLSEQEILRQRVKETRAKASASNVKDERRSAPPTGPAASAADSITSNAVDSSGGKESKDDGRPPPAGPRATRATASVPPAGPASNTRPRATPERATQPPTGPKASPSSLPDKPSPASKPAPASLNMTEQERIAARAQRFSKLTESPTTGAAQKPASPVAPKTDSPARDRKADTPMGPPPVKKEDARNTPQPRSPRRSSPGVSARSRRSGSIESRSSDRTRRPVSDQDRAKEDAERDKVRAQRRAQESTSGRDTPTAEVKSDVASSESAAKQRQEELLQARHDKLASDRKSEDRRSSGSKRETESERAERKAKEREEERQRDKERSSQDEAGTRRSKDEAPRRIDTPERPGRHGRSDRKDREREDRDRDRERDRDDRDRRRTRADDANDSRDRRRDSRDHGDSDRDRHGRRDDRRERDRDRDRERDRDQRDRARPDRLDNRDRDTRNRNDRELLPAHDRLSTRSRDQSPRSSGPPGGARPTPVDGPRGPSSSAAPEAQTAEAKGDVPAPTSNEAPPSTARTQHALPARPGMRSETNGSALPARPVALAARMGPAPGGTSSPNPRPPSPPNPPPADNADTSGSDRKRPPDEAPPLTRESSADAKRPRLDRDRARSNRPVPGNRMLAGAMRAANDK